MKKKILLFSVTAGMLSLALLSNNAGPAASNPPSDGNRTGAFTATCAAPGCHTSNTSTVGSFKKIVDKTNGWDVTGFGYVEGHTYTVTLEGTNTAMDYFGFQACAIYEANQGNAGTLIATAAQTAVRSTKPTIAPDTIKVVEHTGKILSSTGLLNVNFDWAAPPLGSNKGAVRFWGIVNAVDNNTMQTGDQVSAPFQKQFTNVTSVEDLQTTPNVKIWPNPLVGGDRLKIELKNAPTSQYTITAFDMSGRKLFTEVYSSNTIPFEYNTSDWAPGFYHIQIRNNEGMTHTTPLIKY
ncbi:choice-of-anchor V domain-containing protein [Polluticoccus soli]|uniref:choice-of-anchor V domain-containing protein n=1 Tax=Polluticoccus soli TaxID=3034150 RepID=UPI0023E2F40C|nr:choice-of-anchor V domain-containing protein [Flavipsychrobacter sp. JY13-12]